MSIRSAKTPKSVQSKPVIPRNDDSVDYEFKVYWWEKSEFFSSTVFWQIYPQHLNSRSWAEASWKPRATREVDAMDSFVGRSTDICARCWASGEEKSLFVHDLLCFDVRQRIWCELLIFSSKRRVNSSHLISVHEDYWSKAHQVRCEE